MLIRIVKMTFDPSNTQKFLTIYNATHKNIRKFDGCRLLELYRDKNDPSIFMTYSYWESEEHLEAYRNSDLFNSVWAKTKMLFSSKAEAWSVDKIDGNKRAV